MLPLIADLRFLWRYLDMKSFKFKSSSKSSLTKDLHHLKLSSQFKSMPKSTRTNFQLHQTQSLNPPTWIIPWIPAAMSRMLFSCIVNYHSPWRMLVCKPENGSEILPTSWKKFTKKIISAKLTSIMKIFHQRRLLEWFGLLKLMCLHSRPNRQKATFLWLKEMCWGM